MGMQCDTRQEPGSVSKTIKLACAGNKLSLHKLQVKPARMGSCHTASVNTLTRLHDAINQIVTRLKE
jgi:hypothetical protein